MKDCLGASGKGWYLRECPAISPWTFLSPLLSPAPKPQLGEVGVGLGGPEGLYSSF